MAATHSSSSDEPLTSVVDEIPGMLRLHSDGSVTRIFTLRPSIPASPDFVQSVASLDVHFHDPPSDHLWARIFLPHSISSSPPGSLFPLVLHFHGGGMCLGSPADDPFHSFCSRMALKSNAIWISANYRLAPEHRLPAAYDDAYSALKWLHAQACAHATDGQSSGTHTRHDWLSHADFSRCFITGESAGATITHFVAVRRAQSKKDWKPMEIRGLMLVHVSFLMKPRFTTDTDLSSEQVEGLKRLTLPPGITQITYYDPLLIRRDPHTWCGWKRSPTPAGRHSLCLIIASTTKFSDTRKLEPCSQAFFTTGFNIARSRSGQSIGADRHGHPYWNPFSPESPSLAELELPAVLVAVADRDMSYEDGMEYYEALKRAGKDVELFKSEGEGHCFHLFEREGVASIALENHLSDFIHRK